MRIITYDLLERMQDPNNVHPVAVGNIVEFRNDDGDKITIQFTKDGALQICKDNSFKKFDLNIKPVSSNVVQIR